MFTKLNFKFSKKYDYFFFVKMLFYNFYLIFVLTIFLFFSKNQYFFKI